jgi:Putative addiction module component
MAKANLDPRSFQTTFASMSPATEPRHDFPRVIDPDWDAMLARGEEQEVPAWHLEELERIDKGIADGTIAFIPWEEMKARLQMKYGLA